MAHPRHALGLDAERATAAWLSRIGWTVLAHRIRSPGGGEVDLVALDPARTLVGIEVRARRRPRTGRAAETVDARRVARIGRTLVAFGSEAAIRGVTGIRVDLVSLEPEPDTPGRWRLRRTPLSP